MLQIVVKITYNVLFCYYCWNKYTFKYLEMVFERGKMILFQPNREKLKKRKISKS